MVANTGGHHLSPLLMIIEIVIIAFMYVNILPHQLKKSWIIRYLFSIERISHK